MSRAVTVGDWVDTWLSTVTSLGNSLWLLHISDKLCNSPSFPHTYVSPWNIPFCLPTWWVYAPNPVVIVVWLWCWWWVVLIFVLMNIKAELVSYNKSSEYGDFLYVLNLVYLYSMRFAFGYLIFITLFDHVPFLQIISNSPHRTQAHATLPSCGSTTVCTKTTQWARYMVSSSSTTAKLRGGSWASSTRRTCWRTSPLAGTLSLENKTNN